MRNFSSLIVAGSVAMGAVLASSGAFAASAQDDIANLDQLLGTAPSYSSTQSNSPIARAATLRDEAVAALKSGDDATADNIAVLALRKLGEDGTPVDQNNFVTYSNGVERFTMPTVPVNQVTGGIETNSHLVADGRELHFAS